jgi:hypothetical protein
MVKKARGLGAKKAKKKITRSKMKGAAEVRKERQAKVQKKYSNVREKLEQIRASFENKVRDGRYGYERGLRDVYLLVREWERNGKDLEKRASTTAALAGILSREGSNMYFAFLRYVSPRPRQTLSRWSILLSEAHEAGVTGLALPVWLANRRGRR